MNNDIQKPGTQMQSEIDKVGQGIGKNIIDIIKIKIKKVLSGKSYKNN
jgi:hypothetical protein